MLYIKPLESTGTGEVDDATGCSWGEVKVAASEDPGVEEEEAGFVCMLWSSAVAKRITLKWG